MKNILQKHHLFLILIFLFLGSCSSGGYPPAYRLTHCDCKGMSVIPGQECYTLSVQENRGVPESRLIDVFVVVLKALNDNPTGKPTIFLHGGPGNIGTQLIGIFNTEAFRRNHDLIFFDQRGIGRSTPSILCKNLNSLLKADPLVVQQCLDEFTSARADIRGYDTRQSAVDLKGRTDFPGGNGTQLKKSIVTLSDLDVEMLFPGHMGIIEGHDKVQDNFNIIIQNIFPYI